MSYEGYEGFETLLVTTRLPAAVWESAIVKGIAADVPLMGRDCVATEEIVGGVLTSTSGGPAKAPDCQRFRAASTTTMPSNPPSHTRGLAPLLAVRPRPLPPFDRRR